MSVGFVHDWLTGQRGGENVLAEIVRLAPRAPIHTLFHFPGSVDATIESHPIETTFLQRAPLLERRYRHYLPLFPLAMSTLDTRRHALVVSTSHCVAKGARSSAGGRHVCYCHTPMRYVWDQRRAYFAAPRGPAGWVRERILDRLQRWDARTAGRVDEYLANSTFVADRIRRYYRRTAAVIPPPVDVDAFRRADGRGSGGYALMIAALAPYKKVNLAIEACAEARIPLVVVGEGPERRRLEAMAGPEVRFAGRVARPELVELVAGAAFYLQPGVEDFGIATVEALAAGTPVLALGRGGVLDIVEDGRHGLFFSEDEPPEIAAAIDKMRRMQFNPVDLRSRAEEFSAERFRERIQVRLRPHWPAPEGATV